jgi:hypothetical protein
MNIAQLVQSCEEQLRSVEDKKNRIAAETKEIIDNATREGRKNLTRAEDMRIDALIADGEAVKAEIERAKKRLAQARGVEADEERIDAQSRQTHAFASAPKTGDQRLSMNGKVERDTEDSPVWVRSADGRPATVERAQRFADHEVIREQIARAEHRDRPIIEAHGDFGHYVRAMTTTGASAIVPTVWSADVSIQGDRRWLPAAAA